MLRNFNWVICFFVSGMFIFGVTNAMAAKWMDQTKFDGDKFSHPYFQCASMFLGESLCLVFYVIMKLIAKRKQSQANDSLVPKTLAETDQSSIITKFGSFCFALPAFLDLCGSLMDYIGLNLTAISVYQMIRAFRVIIVAIYSVIFLKRHLYKHEVTGIGLIFVGVSIVGLSSILYKSSSSKNPALGIIVICIGLLFSGSNFVIEEKILKKLKIDPLKAVGIEGISGIFYFAIILPILNAIPCHGSDMCGDGYVEDSTRAFYQIGTNGLLFFVWCFFMLTICFFNWTSIGTTSTTSALVRSIADASRAIIIWIISMLVGWEEFVWLQLVGFLILLLGTMTYNEVIILPGFKNSVMKKRHDKEFAAKIEQENIKAIRISDITKEGN